MPELSASDTTAIVLAAGLGTRMKSGMAKVLHPIAGRPLLGYPVMASARLGVKRIVVVASAQTRPQIEEYLARSVDCELSVVVQEAPRGTGDAARVALPEVQTQKVLILCGDTPLVRQADLAAVLQQLEPPHEAQLSLLYCKLDDPTGYGRIVRDASGQVREIREDSDLNEYERSIDEVNAGVYAACSGPLAEALNRLRPANAKQEYYLTDVVRLLSDTAKVAAVAGRAESLVGVNDRVQLDSAEQRLYQMIRERHQRRGVTIRGSARVDADVELEPDVVIETGVCLRGKTIVRRGARIDAGCIIEDSVIDEGAVLQPYCVIAQSSIGKSAEVGPFARLRPESVIEEKARIGNFVEAKRTRLRRGAKASHLAYLGDSDIGENSNIGAGTIFCNYDGYGKHQTVLEANVFVGSDSQLVAPVRIGENAFVASGTTVTEDVPAEALAVGRARQVNKPGYATRLRTRLAQAAGKLSKKG